ncbi:MAG TPA: O-antigen ligase family protein [Thermoanaerobaculia bacterium]|nr:O-antigen ligase family protein [Thermoanaerobaculia bacterium]
MSEHQLTEAAAPLEPARASLPTEHAFWYVLAAGQLIVALAVSTSAIDSFRLPKQIAYRAQTMALLLVVAFDLIYFRSRHRARRDIVFWLTAAIAGWAIITTLTSTNVAISRESLITVLCSITLFTVARRILPLQYLRAVDVVLAAASINAITSVLQLSGLWNPFVLDQANSGKLAITGFLGNPSDVSSTLLGPALLAVALALVVAGWRRVLYAVVALVLLAAIVACQTLTTLGAVTVGLVALAVMVSPRRAFGWGLAATFMLILLVATYAPLKARVSAVRDIARAGRYNDMVSGRLNPSIAAWEMFKDHPVFGVGPGNFHWQYFPYKLEIARGYPAAMVDTDTYGFAENFAEAHNDHVQTLAESGLPGYALMLTSLVVVGSYSRGTSRQTDLPSAASRDVVVNQRRLARLLAFPFALSFGVLCLGQFPLQLAAATNSYIFITALIVGWADVTD